METLTTGVYSSVRVGGPQGAYLCDMVGPGWGETVASTPNPDHLPPQIR